MKDQCDVVRMCEACLLSCGTESTVQIKDTCFGVSTGHKLYDSETKTIAQLLEPRLILCIDDQSFGVDSRDIELKFVGTISGIEWHSRNARSDRHERHGHLWSIFEHDYDAIVS